MNGLPAGLRAHLSAPSLEWLWPVLRNRLERSGHVIRGSVTVELDDDGADRLSGLLGRPVRAGTTQVKLAVLDDALRSSAAGRGLVAVMAELTGGPLRDRPTERYDARSAVSSCGPSWTGCSPSTAWRPRAGRGPGQTGCTGEAY